MVDACHGEGSGEGTCHLPSYGVQGISPLVIFFENVAADMHIFAFFLKEKICIF